MTDQNSNPASAISCCSQPDSLSGTTDQSYATLGQVLADLEGARGLPLAFRYGDCTTKPGYHITEFKFARITGLDCGGNVESWSETVLQLWDIETSVTGDTMNVDKLIGIGRKAMSAVGAERDSRAVFEVSDGSDAMRIFAFDKLEICDGQALVHLKVEVSACKPLVRGILNVPGACGPKTLNPATLGNGEVRRPQTSKCCG
jgi:Family of unknown function (DUF6428)